MITADLVVRYASFVTSQLLVPDLSTTPGLSSTDIQKRGEPYSVAVISASMALSTASSAVEPRMAVPPSDFAE
jgi:hypothetical protein